MKQLYVKYFFLFVLLMPSLSSYAFDVFLDGIYYNLSEKGAVIVKGDKNYSGNVIIPDSINYGGNRYQVIGVGESAFANCTELTGIEFYKGNQSGLSRVINSGKSSYFFIDDNAFNGCTSLTSIDIPAIVTTVGRYAFNGCSNLLNATFSSSSGMVIGGGVEKEQSHNGVTIIHEGAFKGCSSLLKITFPVTLKTIGENAFQDCNKLDSVTVNANIIGKESFMNCSGMTSLTITANVDSIGNRAFYGCRSLATINSSIFTPYPIPEDVFEGLPNDAVLYVPTGSASAYKATAGWNSINTILDRYAVGDTFFSSTVDSIAMTFRVTNKENKTVEVYGTYRGAGTGPGGVYYLEETFYPAIALTTGGTVTIPQTVMGHTVTGISSNAFHGCQWISAVVIPSSVTTIGDRAFEKCSKLKTIISFATTPPAIGTNVFKEEKDNVYSIIASLSAINVPSNCVDEYKYAEGWSEYESLIQEGEYSGGICGDNAIWSFNHSTGVLTISGTGKMYDFDKDSIPWKPLANSITSVIVEDGISSIVNYAFYNCNSLTSVSLGNSITSIEESAFSFCSALISITFPQSITNISNSAFEYCTSLTSITIPNSVTSIGDRAFYGCSGQTPITIPSSVTSIGDWAFNDWDTSVVISKIENPFNIGTNTFSNNTFYNATLYVPVGTVEKHRAAEGWKKFLFIEGSNTPNESRKCEKPTISYQKGKLTFSSTTEGVTYQYRIIDSDIKSGNEVELQLNVIYSINVYATKVGYENSETASATLCWIDSDPDTEGMSSSVLNARTNAVLIQSNNGMLTLTGVPEGVDINVYNLSGQKVGSARTVSESTSVSTSLQTGEVGIVKIGERAIKLILR